MFYCVFLCILSTYTVVMSKGSCLPDVMYKLYKKRTVSNVRATFSERVINVWNFLPKEVDFTSLPRFKCAVQCVDFSGFLECF